MSFWGLVQIFVDIVLIASAGFMWVKLNRPAKDDPRLSKGLQLLGSKISILEDLSDRTETQVKQLTALMEQKVREIQNTLLDAEKQLAKIDASMAKSLEVAKIFQDKIPHQEIIERQNTIKYVKAARLAHQGQSVDQIMQQVDLPVGELEFIAKVNREQLQFSEADLPSWVNDEANEDSPPPAAHEIQIPMIEKVSQAQATQIAPTFHMTEDTAANKSLQGLGEKFRQAMTQQHIPQSLIDTPTFQAKAPQRDVGIKRVVFPRV